MYQVSLSSSCFQDLEMFESFYKLFRSFASHVRKVCRVDFCSISLSSCFWACWVCVNASWFALAECHLALLSVRMWILKRPLTSSSVMSMYTVFLKCVNNTRLYTVNCVSVIDSQKQEMWLKQRIPQITRSRFLQFFCLIFSILFQKNFLLSVVIQVSSTKLSCTAVFVCT